MGKRSAFFLLATVLLQSCVSFFFAQPLPSDATNAKSMPRAIRGQWNSPDGVVSIDKHQWVIQTCDSTGQVVKKEGYRMSDSLKVRQYRNHYFFNLQNKNGYWTVLVGEKSKGHFNIRQLSKTDSALFHSVLGLHPDSTHKRDLFFNSPIGKRELLKYAQKGGFTDTLFVFDLKNHTISN